MSLCMCVCVQIVFCFYTIAHVIKRPHNTVTQRTVGFSAAVMMDVRPLPAADERLNERGAVITAGLKEEGYEEEE